jgi:hypothetical protein
MDTFRLKAYDSAQERILNHEWSKTLLYTSGFASLFITQLYSLTPSTLASDPIGCSSCSIQVGAATSIFSASTGCTVPFVVRIGNAEILGCNQTNLTVLFACPGNTIDTYGPTNVVRTNVAIAAGTTVFTLTDLEGNPLIIPCTISSAPGVTSVRALAYATNNPGGCQRGPIDSAFASGTTSVTVTHPCIQLSSGCLSATNDGNDSIVITYTGSVTNCGDTTLTNIVVVSNQPATNTVVLQASSLAPGGFATFTRTYTNTVNLCGNFTTALSATASDANNQIQGCPASMLSATAVSTCRIPCISVAQALASFELTCTTGAGRNYGIQYTESLSNLNWEVLTNFIGNKSFTLIKDDAGPIQRFYRLVEY